jgi:hypothetical protein
MYKEEEKNTGGCYQDKHREYSFPYEAQYLDHTLKAGQHVK